MKKLFWLILLFPHLIFAQQLNQNYAFTSTGTTTGINVTGRGLTQYQVTYTNAGITAPSACALTLQTSDSPISVPDASAVWSDGITVADCTADGASDITNLVTGRVRINVGTLTRASVSTLTVNIIGWINSLGSGTVTGTGAANYAPYWTSSTNLSAFSLGTDTLYQGTSTSPNALSIPNCGDSTHALGYSTSSHTLSCQTIAGGGGSVPGMDTQIIFNSMGSFGADAGFTLRLPLGNSSGLTVGSLAPQIAAVNIGNSDTDDYYATATTMLNVHGEFVNATNDGGGAVAFFSSHTAFSDAGSLDPVDVVRINGILNHTTGTVVNQNMLHIGGFFIGGATNIHGILIDDISGGTTNEAVHTGAGDIIFGDSSLKAPMGQTCTVKIDENGKLIQGTCS